MKLPPKVKLSKVVIHKKIKRIDSLKSNLDKSEDGSIKTMKSLKSLKSLKSNNIKTPISKSSSNKTSLKNTSGKRLSKKKSV